MIRKPCGTCGTRAIHGDTTGCCASCGRLFRGLRAFDAHWVTPAPGRRSCVDPVHLETAHGGPMFEEISVKGGTAWRLTSHGDNPWRKL